MPQFKKTISNFEETVIEDSFGKRIMLSEFRVPKGFNATDFDLIFTVRDAYLTIKTFSARSVKTSKSNKADLTCNPDISVPVAKLLTIKIKKPSEVSESKLRMTVLYEHAV